jgi:hypothetical protein
MDRSSRTIRQGWRPEGGSPDDRDEGKSEMAHEIDTRRTEWHICKDGPWYPILSHGGYVAYRIWQQFDGLRWFQRHEWKRADGSFEMQPWIKGAEGWCADASSVTADQITIKSAI